MRALPRPAVFRSEALTLTAGAPLDGDDGRLMLAFGALASGPQLAQVAVAPSIAATHRLVPSTHAVAGFRSPPHRGRSRHSGSPGRQHTQQPFGTRRLPERGPSARLAFLRGTHGAAAAGVERLAASRALDGHLRAPRAVATVRANPLFVTSPEGLSRAAREQEQEEARPPAAGRQRPQKGFHCFLTRRRRKSSERNKRNGPGRRGQSEEGRRIPARGESRELETLPSKSAESN